MLMLDNYQMPRGYQVISGESCIIPAFLQGSGLRFS